MATKKEVMELATQIRPMLPDGGNGWMLRTWENLGWHFELFKGIVTVTKNGNQYHCFIRNAGDGMSGVGPCSAFARTPKAAIRKAVQQMCDYAKKEQEFWQGVEKQLQDF